MFGRRIEISKGNWEGKAAPGRGSLLKVGGWRVWFWVASRSPLLGGLGRTGRGHRSPWVDPAVLILSLLFWWLQDLREKGVCECTVRVQCMCVCVCVDDNTPEKSTWVTHPHSSFHRRCQTPRSSLALRTEWPTAALQRTHNHLQPPAKHDTLTKTKTQSTYWRLP